MRSLHPSPLSGSRPGPKHPAGPSMADRATAPDKARTAVHEAVENATTPSARQDTGTPALNDGARGGKMLDSGRV